LQGRAIQDVWILPDFFYGTTLRVYDPGIAALGSTFGFIAAPPVHRR
jgi:hypothetical protein